MNQWTREVTSWRRDEIEKAVACRTWQVYRGSLKGLRTTEKLERLDLWLHLRGHSLEAQCQVDNYINALKRGGQLSMELTVVR